MSARIGIIIPVYNSPDHLPELLQRVTTVCQEMQQQIHLLIVDDGSRPPLSDFSDKCDYLQISQIKHPQNLGKGRALKSGFAYFLAQESINGVVTIDGDLQHPPELLPQFFSAFEKNAADLVIGVRRRDRREMPFHRILSNMTTSAIISLMIGHKVSDSQCGFRLYGRKALQEINLSENRFHLESEFVIRAGWRKMKFCEIPVPTIYNGAPSAIRNLPDTLNFIGLILRLLGKRMMGNV